ncbi:cardiolipin synthase [Geobacter sp. SVR]|uniref:cardiolipin synthase n=1 Tax=Geobacter sp. SVR TaxID=2495594 RepID=UPI00143F033C|nr:cardiolipin synthase [Geobacter sp. SVR]BCS52145.1 cardiolipin synthase [Geobacter sp. SVR]GCF86600.1 cardiolipin synthase [Geobacter sp. SVR]
MDHLLTTFFLFGYGILSLLGAGHALLHKRDSRSALGWMSLCLTLPYVGPLLYWCLGINRISRRAHIWKKSGRRISGIAIRTADQGTAEPPPLPPSAYHLRDLRRIADRLVKTPLRPGNLITPLINGEQAYPAMLEAIGRARSSINLCSYIFDADGVGAEFIRHLKEAAQRGVQVRVIIDALGEKYSRLSPRTALAGSGVHLERYLPLRHGAYINLRNHRKLLTIDGIEAFTGGMNIRSRHVTSQTPIQDAVSDMHFHVQGPVVNDLQSTFLEDWHFVTGKRLDDPLFFPPPQCQGSMLARCISDGPDKEYRKLEQILMGAMSCAGQSILIMSPYFIPDRPMTSAMITAALRGVDVRVLLPEKNNLPFMHWANRALQAELIANGIRLYYQPPPFAHTKLFLVDDTYTLIGSSNLDARSLRLNFELDLSIYDSAFASLIRRHFETCLDASREITPAELQSRGLPVQLRDNFARLLSPYL